MQVKILAVGDVCGDPGLQFLERKLKTFQQENNIAFTVVNGENANVVGITPRQADMIFRAGADVITLGNHTWNRIKLGGKWYHVDVTWDDPVPDQLGYAIHTYFLVSDAFLSSTDDGKRPHYGWKGYGDDIACTYR